MASVDIIGGELRLIFWLLLVVLLVLLSPGMLTTLLSLTAGPFLLRIRTRVKADAVHVAIGREQLSGEAEQTLAMAESQLAVAGFSLLGILKCDDMVAGMEGVTAAFVNPRSGDTAQVIHITGRMIRSTSIVIASEFVRGPNLSTATATNIGYLPRNPSVEAEVFSCVKDAATIAEIHRRRLQKSGKARWPRREPADSALALVQRCNADSFRWFVESGYHYLDGSGATYRLTWKGAGLAAWKLTPAIARWRSRRREAAARRLWAELGMEEWQLPLASVSSPAPATSATALAAPPMGDALPMPPALAEAYAEPPAPQPLGYARTLGPGEIRYVREGDQLRAWIGGFTRGQYLLGQWARLLLMGLWAALLLGPVVLGLAQYGTPMLFFSGRYWMVAGSFGLLLLIDVVTVWKGLRAANGTTSLTASQAGLTFENVAGSPKHGKVRRGEIALLSVQLKQAALFRKAAYALALSVRDSGQSVCLAVSRDRAALQQLRNELAWGMGIERPPSQEGGGGIGIVRARGA